MSENYVSMGVVLPLYPNRRQTTMFRKTFGCVRFVYNNILSRQNERLEANTLLLSYEETSKILTSMKKEYEFLREVDSSALQPALKRQRKAWDNFFKEGNGQPRFKKKCNDSSYTSKNNNDAIRISGNFIRIPKVGWVKTKLHQQVEGRIKEIAIRYEKNGRYYVAVSFDNVKKESLNKTNKEIGIDAGLMDLLTLSNGENLDNKRFYKSVLDKLSAEQTKLSYMQKGSNNYERQRRVVARLSRKIVNKRKDYYHKLSKRLVTEYDRIFIETLDIKSMKETKSKERNKNVSDASWASFFIMLDYKAQWYGKTVYAVPQFYPSSQTCHACGYVNTETKDEHLREWTCPVCGVHHDRDVNAAINILNEGKRCLENGIVDGRIEKKKRNKAKKLKKKNQATEITW